MNFHPFSSFWDPNPRSPIRFPSPVCESPLGGSPHCSAGKIGKPPFGICQETFVRSFSILKRGMVQ
ncbi:MAG: hypothetical protein C6P37_05140 [Caldibacillus debilis]|uniref:Uncharacterized protein n=1 Tax=Caldibacillus debilis TaxID=301148 RepID=A0A3E0K6L9_9BACI|nr:MAG: hypothetical protein C6W57_10120 [Caldibacillus debilis]REJ27921.1 MAG: hypothetical protein C6W56_09460 [Caldibacillus debilis]REJ29344.1 MAG: hypothetical protein C6P37_05140 [Caldibacillus debilis]